MSRYLYQILARMGVFLIMVLGLIVWLLPHLEQAFLHNIALNSLIVSLICLGWGWCFYVHYRLTAENRFFEEVQTVLSLQKRSGGSGSVSRSCTLLRPLQDFLEHPPHHRSEMARGFLISTLENRFGELRDMSRYLMGLLIFLGLLGTFWGLSQMISAITHVIKGVDLLGGDVQTAFQTLKEGLLSPLGGMGTAFSASMFGLVGSLSVGFLDLQNGRAIKKMVSYLEDYIHKHLGTPQGTALSMHGHGVGYSTSLLEGTLESLNQLTINLQKNEDNRLLMIKSIQSFATNLTDLTDRLGKTHAMIQKLSQNQMDIQEAIHHITRSHSEEPLRNLMKTLDHTLGSVLEEVIEGRKRSTDEIKSEIRMVTRTLSALAQNAENE